MVRSNRWANRGHDARNAVHVSEHTVSDGAKRTRLLAIVNPISGRRDVTHVVSDIRRRLAARGAELVVQATNGPLHARELARAVPTGTQAILVVGGDGTVNEVLEGLDRLIPMAILPTGTENLLAKYLRMPRRPAAVAEMLLFGEGRAQDLGRVNGRGFHSVVGVGFDAECVERLAAVRRGHIGYGSYVVPILRTFVEHRFPRIRVELDGAALFEGHGFAIAGLIPRYAAGLRVLPFADPSDGLLDVICFECSTRRRLLRHAISVVLRRHLRGGGANDVRATKGVHFGRAARVSITSPEPVRVEIDGDPGGSVPIELDVRSGAAIFLGPP